MRYECNTKCPKGHDNTCCISCDLIGECSEVCNAAKQGSKPVCTKFIKIDEKEEDKYFG